MSNIIDNCDIESFIKFRKSGVALMRRWRRKAEATLVSSDEDQKGYLWSSEVGSEVKATPGHATPAMTTRVAIQEQSKTKILTVWTIEFGAISTTLLFIYESHYILSFIFFGWGRRRHNWGLRFGIRLEYISSWIVVLEDVPIMTSTEQRYKEFQSGV